ncbi:MAG: polysaccharide deacetylase family protein [Rhodospirillales bacterium]|jgi:peptidoglycan/xylan/chitin deacetylase (PgdA/CDA1 family)|nr:polysaccharide deacetylase family protein [Rhodospirillales bacterium]
MMLRHRLARPWLWALRSARAVVAGKDANAFRILIFHHIPHDARDAFAALVAELRRNHGVLAPEDAEARLAGRPTHSPGGAPEGRGDRLPCLLSFDDGFASNFDVANEVLATHDIRALFFVCPGLVDLEADEQREGIARGIFQGRLEADELGADLRLMSWSEIAELKAQGHTIGAHGLVHRKLTRLAGEELAGEVVEAGDILEERLGAPVAWFAYAFGTAASVSRPAFELIAERYRYCRSGVRGQNTPTTNPHALLADAIDLGAPADYHALIIEGGLDLAYVRARTRLAQMAAP